MLVEFGVVPLGQGTSVSKGLAPAIKLVAESGLNYKVGSMGTVIEGEWDQVMPLVRRCHEAVLKQAGRVMTHINIDDRTDKQIANRITAKVESVEKALGIVLKK